MTLDETIAHYQKALDLNPNLTAAHINLGNVLQTQGRFEDAIQHYRKALQIDPGQPAVYNNLAAAILGARGNYDDAVACFEQAIALKPDYGEAHLNLAKVLRAQIMTLMEHGRYDDALACCQRALSFHPDSAEVHFFEAHIRLVTGDMMEGWRKYEWRWLANEAKSTGLASPLWDGGDLEGRTILLYSEQGLGDNIQCVRFAGRVKEKNGAVLLFCPPSLTRLFKDVAGIDGVYSDARELPGHHVHAPLMSLPGLFETALDTIPAAVPYLQADPERVKIWRERLAGCRGFKIGIVWRGNPTHKNDRNRSMSAAQFAEFLDLPGVAIVSLQKDGAPDEMETLGQLPVPFFDAAPLLQDFGDTAGLMANLDLVITVDTSVCHLAGALAIPVWTLIPFAPDWRWLLEREDSPWYPTMRLFRQPRIGDWQSVIARVRAMLSQSGGGGLPLSI